MTVRRLAASALSGPRAYFMDMDPFMASPGGDPRARQRRIEERLKALLLFKPTVVSAASALAAPVGLRLLMDNPELLSEGLVTPALREDRAHVADYLDGPGGAAGRRFLEENVRTVVSWNVAENSGWFQARLVAALKDPRSELRCALAKAPPAKLGAIAKGVAANGVGLSRDTVADLAAPLAPGARRVLLDYVNLLYHVSGARVVNCESALPQERYVDYRRSDFARHRVALSETEVFLKLFLEEAFHVLQRAPLPRGLVSDLRFDEVCAVRDALNRSPFPARYDAFVHDTLVAIAGGGLNDDERLHRLERPMETLAGLSQAFRETLQAELPRHFRRRARRQAVGLVAPAVAVASGLATGPVAAAAGFAGGAGGLRSLVVNGHATLRTASAASDHEGYAKWRRRELRRRVARLKVRDGTAFVDALQVVLEPAQDRMRI